MVTGWKVTQTGRPPVAQRGAEVSSKALQPLGAARLLGEFLALAIRHPNGSQVSDD